MATLETIEPTEYEEGLFQQHELFLFLFATEPVRSVLGPRPKQLYNDEAVKLSEQHIPALKLMKSEDSPKGVEISNQLSPESAQEILLRPAVRGTFHQISVAKKFTNDYAHGDAIVRAGDRLQHLLEQEAQTQQGQELRMVEHSHH